MCISSPFGEKSVRSNQGKYNNIHNNVVVFKHCHVDYNGISKQIYKPSRSHKHTYTACINTHDTPCKPIVESEYFPTKKKKEKKERASFETCTECISINRKIRSTYVCCMGNKIKTKMCIVKLGALCSFVWCFAYSREGKSKVYCNSITKLTPTYGKWNDQCWMKNSRWQHWIGSNIFISQLHPYNA